MTELLDFDETTRWVEGDVRLHYHEAGEGPTLILLHGSGPGVSGWSNFKGNLPVFAKTFRTIVLDMPGFGLSGDPTFDDVYPKVAARYVVSFMDSLGIDKAHLLGNSMGGYVATEVALAHPERVDRMVGMGSGGLAVNILGPEGSEGAKALYRFFADPTEANMLGWVDCMVGDKSVITDDLIAERTANALKDGALERAMGIFATFGQFPDAEPPWAKAHTIQTKTLLTWGRDDRMLPLESGLFAFRRMPNAEFHIFSNCGHWAQVERKDEFERIVTEFLTRDD